MTRMLGLRPDGGAAAGAAAGGAAGRRGKVNRNGEATLDERKTGSGETAATCKTTATSSRTGRTLDKDEGEEGLMNLNERTLPQTLEHRLRAGTTLHATPDMENYNSYT